MDPDSSTSEASFSTACSWGMSSNFTGRGAARWELCDRAVTQQAKIKGTFLWSHP